ncbi:MAG: hypothetical protein V3573_02430 [Desulfovibrionaceae bacterium]
MRSSALALLLLPALLLAAIPARAQEAVQETAEGAPLVDMEWGGHLMGLGSLTFPPGRTSMDSLDGSPLTDGLLELRLLNKTFLGDSAYVDVHYEARLQGGETRSRGKELARRYPWLHPDGLVTPEDDDRRLMDLSWTAWKDDGTVLSHRLDRLCLTLVPDWGEIRLGRQALTWGNGLVFNPLDLFNPFAPTDTVRDYKLGDDMALVQFQAGDAGIQLIYTPHRDPRDGAGDWEQASLGGKAHFSVGETEIDLLAAKHYEDEIVGAGLRGYAGDAAWRLDASWTFLEERNRGRDGYLSLAANLDYSWNWLGKNWYGFVEIYHNGLSNGEPTESLADPVLSERLARGELHTLGSLYGAAHVEVEVHPLVTLLFTGINNLGDGSTTLLPGLRWSLSDNLELRASGAVFLGDRETEYGGFEVPGTGFESRPSDSFSTRLTWYF